MAAFLSIALPTTLRQWLRQSLGWAGLCCLTAVAASYLYTFFPTGSGQAGSAVGVFLLFLLHVRITFILARQVSLFEPLYQRHKQAIRWPLGLAAHAWWLLLLLLTGIWVMTDAVLLLVWLFAAGDDGSPWFGLLTVGDVAGA